MLLAMLSRSGFFVGASSSAASRFFFDQLFGIGKYALMPALTGTFSGIGTRSGYAVTNDIRTMFSYSTVPFGVKA